MPIIIIIIIIIIILNRGSPLVKIFQLEKNLQEAVHRWLPVRRQTIREIRKVADNLQEHHRNVDISKIAGSTASVIGGALAITGFALTPITLGTSLILSGVGIGVGTLGGATVAGAALVDGYLEKWGIEGVQKKIDEDHYQYKKIQERRTEMEETVKEVYTMYASTSAKDDGDDFGRIMSQFFGTTLIRGQIGVGMILGKITVGGSVKVGMSVAKVGQTVAKGVSTASVVATVVLMPVDLYQIVQSSFSLARGSHTAAIEKLREHANELEKEMESVQYESKRKSVTTCI